MMEAFKAGKRLHYKYAVQMVNNYRRCAPPLPTAARVPPRACVHLVCGAACRYAGELPTLVEAEVVAGTTLTVVGDTHGQLKDLFAIFTINGVPSPTNRCVPPPTPLSQLGHTRTHPHRDRNPNPTPTPAAATCSTGTLSTAGSTAARSASP
jgi:hypothetical protein